MPKKRNPEEPEVPKHEAFGMSKRPKPDVDATKCAEEVKAWLNREKYNLVDSDKALVEGWPEPDDPETPELSKFRTQHEDMFAYIAGMEIDDDGTGYPHDLTDSFKSVIAEIEDKVNSDAGFWEALREVVLPLYGKISFSRKKDGGVDFKETPSKDWEKRWKKVSLFYDPFASRVVTTLRYKNNKTGEFKEGQKTVSDREIPAGFVIKVI